MFFSCKKDSSLNPKETFVKTLNITSLIDQVEIGKSINLDVEIYPMNNNNKKEHKILWTSSDEKIATVSNGKVTGVKKGVVTISAEIEGTKIRTEIKVHVIPILITSINLTLQKSKISYGEKNKINVELFPKTADPKDYKINFTADKLFLEVDPDGNVKPLRASVPGYPNFSTVKVSVEGTNVESEIVVDVDYRITYGELNKSVLMPNGLYLTVRNIAIHDLNSYTREYYIYYNVENKTSKEKIDESYIYLVSKEGKKYKPGIWFGASIFPGENKSNHQRFKELKNVEMDYFVYDLPSYTDEVRIKIK